MRSWVTFLALIVLVASAPVWVLCLIYLALRSREQDQW